MALRVLLASLVGFLALFCHDVQAGDDCYTYRKPNRKTYCQQGCCGYSYDEYCCDYSDSVGLSVAAIIGIVIGCICLICVIIAIICCCIKTKGKQGRVVQPNAVNQPNVTVIYRAHGNVGQPGPAYGMHPMGGPAGPYPPNNKLSEFPPPPAYNYSDPVYPPGAVPGPSNTTMGNQQPPGYTTEPPQ